VAGDPNLREREERDPYAALYAEMHRPRFAGGCVRVRHMNTRLVLEDQLDFNARIEFSMRASELVRHADGELGVDCSGINQIDEPLIGLLTWLTRNARQRGLVVVLEGATPGLLAGLERAGVLDRFVCQA
jgi:ABC-type transporter Mla MlaB component